MRIVCVLALVGSSAVALPADAAPPRPSISALLTEPSVSFQAPASPLRSTVIFGATAIAHQDPTSKVQVTITSVEFYYRAMGTTAWTPLASATQGVAANLWVAPVDTTALPNGVYDFSAVATESSGQSSPTIVSSDVVVANNATYVGLANPGSPLSEEGGNGNVTLTATTEPSGSTPDEVTFLDCPTNNCPANPANWQPLGTVQTQFDSNGNPLPTYTYSLDTTTLPDGSYDFAVTADDATSNPPGDPFQGGAITNIVVDNTPPSINLDNPGGAISGVTTLKASPTDSGGVASVKFEVAPAGTDNWTTVGVAATSPYSVSVDTRQFSDGSYDIRAEAADNAGNTGFSQTYSGVSISNPGAAPLGGLTLTHYVAPATNIQLLGELPGPEHETWAIGQTNAPPPVVNGTKLPYTATGNGQVVLLRYTDDTGWQIVDVLRDQNGNAYPLPAGSVTMTGAMTASGEAWVAVAGVGLFHRLPGGPFEFDPPSTSNLDTSLGTLLTGDMTMRLGQTSDGTQYGILTAAQPPADTQTVPSANGPVSVTTKLSYARLDQSGWTAVNSPLPPDYSAPPGVTGVRLVTADVTGPDAGWAALQEDGAGGSAIAPLILAQFDASGWTFHSPTGLDALDLTDAFAPDSQQSVAAMGNRSPMTYPELLRVSNDWVWLGAGSSPGATSIVARIDTATGRVVQSWCATLPLPSVGCTAPLDPSLETVPDASFGSSPDSVDEALGQGFIDAYYHGAWTSVPAPGVFSGNGGSVFVDATDGWLKGANTLVRVSPAPIPSPLASWPAANRNPLLSVALPPGSSTTNTPGTLAVGMNGTALHYDASAGWQVDPTPARTHHIQLTGVAFASPSLAFAVGQEGVILRWDGSSWSEDPQSVQATTKSLNAVSCGPDGECWAVGGFGAILHWDGTSWSTEQLDLQDSGEDITSVAVAGGDVYAIANGNLFARDSNGSWAPVPAADLPSSPPPAGSLRLVSGLPDGGVAVAGKSLLMVRSSSSVPFDYSPQSFNGIPVALAAFRGPGGDVRAFLSVAPPIQTASGLSDDVGGFPAGDGDLIVETDGGWQDLSRDLPARSDYNATGEGAVQPDPVLAVAASPDGSHAWAVGGYAGTQSADGVGTSQILSARPQDWFTSNIWRYDAGGSASSPTTTQATVTLPASPDTVSFAFLTSALCKKQCSEVADAQPDVNLSTAATQIAAFAQQPGGPAFAMIGGNIRGGIPGFGADPTDMARLPQLLAPMAGVPTYAAYGPADYVSADQADPALPWAQDFAGSPAPFGSAPAPAGITPQSSGDRTGPVNKYYAFDVSQNGGTVRAIVLDNSAGSLDGSAPGQTAWLSGELSQAQAAGLPVVVFAARPLNINDPGAASDADSVASQLAAAGVLAVFTTSGGEQTTWQNQPDQVAEVPADAAQGAPQIPEYEGATMTYQQEKNNGVLWYDVSINTATQAVSVNGIPVISDLALEPLDGLSAARSSTLSFQAIGRRPPGTIATTPLDPTFPGFDQYVSIPAASCSGCIGPSYSFTSSNPVVGDFVAPSSPGSPFPKLTAEGKTIHSSTSGLFCAYNSGTTTVSVTSGLLTSSLPVTVQAGGFGPPCGTVPGGASENVVNVPGPKHVVKGSTPGVGPVHLTPTPLHTTLPKIAIPHLSPTAPAPIAKPVPAVAHTPAQQQPFIQQPVPQVPPAVVLPVVVPPIPAPVTPVPPGGATASAQASARREEKARQQAKQSAYVIRPAGTSASDWFYPAVGVVTVLTLLLIAGGVRPGPGRKPAFVPLGDPARPRRRQPW